jgi:hypothetical protein
MRMGSVAAIRGGITRSGARLVPERGPRKAKFGIRSGRLFVKPTNTASSEMERPTSTAARMVRRLPLIERYRSSCSSAGLS